MTHERFHYKTLEDVKAKAAELGLTLPFAEDTHALATPLTVRNIPFPNRMGIAPMEGADSLPDGSPSDYTTQRYVKEAVGGAAIIWFEAISIVENGIADAATVDEAVRYSFGLRLPQLGPMENADMVGTDLTYNIHDYILKDLEDSHEPSPLLKQLRDEGKIGFKTGEGFQKWTPEQVAHSNAELNEYLIRMLYGK